MLRTLSSSVSNIKSAKRFITLTDRASHIRTKCDASSLPPQMVCYHSRHPNTSRGLAPFCRPVRPRSSSDLEIVCFGEIGQQSAVFGSRPGSLHLKYQSATAVSNVG